MGWHQILVLLCFLCFLHSFLPLASPLCPPDQRDALLHFKNSLVLDSKASLFSCDEYVGITSYPKTNSWNKGVDCCSWEGVMCDNVTGNVVELDLNCSWLCGTLHSISSLFPLRHLQSLDLVGNNFAHSHISRSSSPIPATTPNLSYSTFSLEVLGLAFCSLTEFPYFLNSLKRLRHLALSHNRIRGEIPTWFWEMNHDTLETIYLSHNLLEGGIPQLHWKRLSEIDLQNNSFRGPLPIPPPSTSYFDASHNGFAGEIPSSICQLSSLTHLDLSNNNLSGIMPPCFGNITNLQNLNLSSNKLRGPLPRSLVECEHLSELVLSRNEFSDTFPRWLEAPHLEYLDLRSNKFHGAINLIAFELSFPALQSLFIANNNFTGQWPIEGFSNTSMYVIDLSNNMFAGPIPLPSPIAYYYSIASNKITGKVPSSLCNATKLALIDLSNNGLTGNLPWCLTNLSSLSVLNLRMNHLEGKLPQSFSWRNNLTTLDMSRNQLEGTLPRSLGKCKNLEVLDLGDNQIEDTFPTWLGTLPELKVLVLRSNNLKGIMHIPKGAGLFPELHILDLSNNNFGGPLPANLIMNLKGMMNSETRPDTSLYMTWSFELASYENSVTVTVKGKERELVKILTVFTTIDLSHNFFHGDIPGVIGHLHSLIGLNLSHNYLTSYIPSTLGNLTNLGWLDLSSNKLSGGVPRNLADLASLGYLNLSKNQLSGRIPQDKQLSTFSSDSFNGNPGLCGTPLPKACPGDAQPPPPLSSSPVDRERHESWFKHETVWIGYASGVVIGMSIAYISFETGRPVWLARGVWMLERRAAEWMGKPKWKAIRFRGQ